MKRALLLLALLASTARADQDVMEEFAGRFSGGAMTWKIVLIQDGDIAKDVWGGRAWGSARLAGGLHAVLRLDASALPGDEFNAGDPETYKAFEGYGGVHYAFRVGEAQLGPAAIAGLTRGFDLEGQELSGNPKTYGAGARLGLGGAWLYALIARHEAAGDGWRLLAAAQVPIWEGMTLVADYVSGEGGFVRMGIGYAVGAGQ